MKVSSLKFNGFNENGKLVNTALDLLLGGGGPLVTEIYYLRINW